MSNKIKNKNKSTKQSKYIYILDILCETFETFGISVRDE